MANLQFIPNAVSKSSASASLTLEDVPESVRQEVEQVYDTLKTNPGRMRAEFETLAEMNTYIAQVQAYCNLRTDKDGNAAPIRFRKSPSRGLKATQMDFRITDLKTENEAKTEEIRDAVENVKATAKK